MGLMEVEDESRLVAGMQPQVESLEGEESFKVLDKLFRLVLSYTDFFGSSDNLDGEGCWHEV